MKNQNSAPKITPLEDILEQSRWKELGYADGFYSNDVYKNFAVFPPAKFMKIYVNAFIESILTKSQIGW